MATVINQERAHIAIKEIEYLEKSKKMSIAYLLWFFFGMFGAHNFYTNDTVQGLLKLALMSWTFFFFIVGIGLPACVLMLGVGACWIVDLFLIPTHVKRQNWRVKQELGMA